MLKVNPREAEASLVVFSSHFSGSWWIFVWPNCRSLLQNQSWDSRGEKTNGSIWNASLKDASLGRGGLPTSTTKLGNPRGLGPNFFGDFKQNQGGKPSLRECTTVTYIVSDHFEGGVRKTMN